MGISAPQETLPATKARTAGGVAGALRWAAFAPGVKMFRLLGRSKATPASIALALQSATLDSHPDRLHRLGSIKGTVDLGGSPAVHGFGNIGSKGRDHWIRKSGRPQATTRGLDGALDRAQYYGLSNQRAASSQKFGLRICSCRTGAVARVGRPRSADGDAGPKAGSGFALLTGRGDSAINLGSSERRSLDLSAYGQNRRTIFRRPSASGCA